MPEEPPETETVDHVDSVLTPPRLKLLRELSSTGWTRWLPVQLPYILLAAGEASPTNPDPVRSLPRAEPLWYPPLDEDAAALDERYRRAAGRFAAAAGLPFPLTWGDLSDLAHHYGLLVADVDGHLRLARPLPVVAETGVLTVEEVASEDAQRWRDQFYGMAQEITAVLVRDRHRDGPVGHRSCTIATLAAAAGLDVEDARQGLLIVLGGDDFRTHDDVETIDVDDVLSVSIDWAAFDEDRIFD